MHVSFISPSKHRAVVVAGGVLSTASNEIVAALDVGEVDTTNDVSEQSGLLQHSLRALHPRDFFRSTFGALALVCIEPSITASTPVGRVLLGSFLRSLFELLDLTSELLEEPHRSLQ